jgi:hypothetical protein
VVPVGPRVDRHAAEPVVDDRRRDTSYRTFLTALDDAG